MLISICACFSGMVFAWAPFLARWLGTCILLCIVAAVAKSCIFICICLYICEDNAFAPTLWDGMEFVGLWGCSGFESTHTGLPSTSPKQRSSSSVRPRPPFTREIFLPFEKWNWFRCFFKLAFPKRVIGSCIVKWTFLKTSCSQYIPVLFSPMRFSNLVREAIV